MQESPRYIMREQVHGLVPELMRENEPDTGLWPHLLGAAALLTLSVLAGL